MTLNDSPVWGGGSTINTTLTSDKILGHIDVQAPTIIDGIPFSKVAVNDQAPLPADTEDYIFVNGNGKLSVNFDTSSISVNSTNPYVSWVLGSLGDGNIHLYRLYHHGQNLLSRAISDIMLVGGDESDSENIELLLAELGSNSPLWESLSEIQDPEERGRLLRLMVNEEAGLQTNAVINNNLNNLSTELISRISNVSNKTMIGAGDDDVSSRKYGVWG
ncbi:MAG: hypothetical protein RCG15_02855 [Candidatus Rickettsia vulgarisii]